MDEEKLFKYKRSGTGIVYGIRYTSEEELENLKRWFSNDINRVFCDEDDKLNEENIVKYPVWESLHKHFEAEWDGWNAESG